jgi:hypothetical protein
MDRLRSGHYLITRPNIRVIVVLPLLGVGLPFLSPSFDDLTIMDIDPSRETRVLPRGNGATRWMLRC